MSASDAHPGSAPNDAPPLNVREAMWRIRVAWMFGAAWMFTTTSVALTKFAQCLNLPLKWYGMLGALPLIGAVTALPTTYFIARYGCRKRIFLIAGIAYRSLWVPIALIPWVLPSAWWWKALMVLQALASLAAYVMIPAVLSWYADVVPARIRGRFFSRWSQGGQIVGMLATFLVTYCLDWAEPAGQLALLRTISITFAVAALLGVADFLWLLPIPDVGHRPDPQITLAKLFREPLADRSFLCYLAFNATRVLSLGYLGQYVYLYLSQVLGMDSRMTNVMVLVVPTLVSLLVLGTWGKLVDRLGCKPVLIIGTIGVIHGAVAWILVTPEAPWVGYVAVLVSVAAWTGVDAASFNLMLRMSASHGGRRQGSAYLAMNSVAIAVAGALSGVLGGAVAGWLGKDWHGALLGLPLTYHGVLFIISSALRVLALPWLFLLHEPGAHTPSAAVQYVLTAAQAKLQQAVRRPLDAMRQLGRREDDD